jgi:Polyketide cyclase / dehydrase and lipid transport
VAKYTGTVTSPRPIGVVFDYMADFANVSEWDPSAIEARSLNGSKAERGSTYAVTSRFMGREVPITYETVEIDRPSRVVLRGESDAVVSIDTMTFEELADGGTRLTYHADLSLKGPRRLLDPVLGISFRRLCGRARAKMQEVLSA